jgi:protoheme IX farnesyltransferase
LGALFLAGAVRVRTARDESSARRLFGFSIIYLFSIFALLVIDNLIGLIG